MGACQAAVLSTYLPDRNDFTDHHLSGMLELVSLSGNITFDGGALHQHAHATLSELGRDGEPHVIAGHLTSATVMYTGEITIQPVVGVIPRKFDDNVGITVWNLD
ncbi:PPC domain-containing DNA-binding protein [Lacticaseibacillus pantheris]|uniref:PPC domain-containing DNA-binding protein n=1 Tax=Lacticaseibacillus pantheris TaxID=171523 RepID=UPI001CDAF559